MPLIICSDIVHSHRKIKSWIFVVEINPVIWISFLWTYPISNTFFPFLSFFFFSINHQDLVGPLAPSAPYTPLQAVPPPGMAGLHSPPLTSSPRHHQGSPRQALHGASRGLVSGGMGDTSSPARRPREFDVRAEMEKHKFNLSIDDWSPRS